MHNIVSLLCLSFVIFVVALFLYPLNQSFSIAAFEPVYSYDDLKSGNVDTSRYIDGNYTDFEGFPVDLWATSYQSDGENLNLTLWLMDTIVPDNHADYASNGLYYLLNIFSVDPVNGTSVYKIYSINVSPEEDGTWTKTLYEWSPPFPDRITQLPRIVKQYYNYSNLFLINRNYVHIPISLAEIGDPKSFNVDFHAYALNNTLHDRFPYTSNVPPGQNTLIFEPRSLNARAGESSSHDISVHGIELSARMNVSLNDANEEDDFGLSFLPERLDFDLNETQKTTLKLDLSSDVQSGQTVPVDVLVNRTTIEGISANHSETFSLEVFPPQTIEEKTLGFLQNYYGFYWIPVAVAGVFGLWFTRGMNQKVTESMELTHIDILTVNASVIVGVLIFLTIGSEALFAQTGILTATIVVPFAVSILMTLRYGQVRQSIKLTILGFVYLIVSVILIGFGTGFGTGS